MEQQRDSHKGFAGLRQTWQGIIARTRMRARYMSLFRRLLTVGMRSVQTEEAAAVAAAAATAAAEKAVGETSTLAASARANASGQTPASASPDALLSSFATMPKLNSNSTAGISTISRGMRRCPSAGSMAAAEEEGGVVGGGGGVDEMERRRQGEREKMWDNVGGSATEIRKLADKISQSGSGLKRVYGDDAVILQVR